MLTITVNGRVEKLHIGCRTCISLNEMLNILDVDDKEVTLNGEKIRSMEFEKTIVSGGDKLIFAM